MVLKTLERRSKAFLIRALGALTRARGAADRPDWGSRPHRVLYLRYDRIGDMVLATGIIKAIRDAHPTVAVDVLASPANAGVLRGNPHVDRVLTFDKSRPWTYPRAIVRMRRRRYDAVIDAMVMAPSLTTMMLMWASGARHRIGVGDRGNAYALTLPVPRVRHAEHYVDHSAAILAAFGVDPQRTRPARIERATATPDGASGEPTGTCGGWGVWRPEIYLAPDEWSEAEERWSAVRVGMGGGRAAMWRLVANVSAGGRWRYWPESSFIAVLSRVRARFPDVWQLVIGAPDDEARMQRIGRGAGVPVATTAGYRQMMALVATADFVLTADTSVTHIASAFGKPSVVMFARGRAPLYGPYGPAGCAVVTPALALDALPVAPVAAAVEAMLAAGTRDHSLLASRVPAFHPRAGASTSTSSAGASTSTTAGTDVATATPPGGLPRAGSAAPAPSSPSAPSAPSHLSPPPPPPPPTPPAPG